MRPNINLHNAVRRLLEIGERLPVRSVHHWRGRKFVTAKRCVVSAFAGLVVVKCGPDVLTPLGVYQGTTIYASEPSGPSFLAAI